jgi:NDP-sugar pyrophosphorylase family protein
MVNVVIPMAGRGSRFEQAGYTFPKPLIDVNNKPMIQVVVENIGLKANYIFLALKEHYDKYALKYLMPLICGGNSCQIVLVDTVTEGAACTVLLAKEHINNDDELFIANSDQWVDWRSDHFMQYMRNKNADAGILTFHATHPKWSFAKVDYATGLVTEVAEKKPISNIATVGIYYYKHGNDFVKGAEQMIAKNIRVNNEFYVCPVFNELIGDGKKVYNYPVAEMQGLGTPEDLAKFLSKR